ncbi:MAG: ABC transporter ATP-binding protein [Cyclobacteriaceae bacterium]
MPSVLEANQINKYFYEPTKFQVLKNVTFSIERGSFVAIIGKSGSGKSTLMYLLSTMDTDYEGEIIVNKEQLTGKKQKDLARFRNENIGFVFQFHFLLPEFSVLQNLMLPAQKLGRWSDEEIEQRAYDHLKTLGVADQASKLANKLSGGQQQRVAIARALMNDPLIVMGDEPTGNLDSVNSEIVFDTFHQISREQQQTIIMVTHDEDLAARTDQIIELKDGEVIRH